MHLSIVIPPLPTSGKGGDMWAVFPLLTLSYAWLNGDFLVMDPRPWYVGHVGPSYTARIVLLPVPDLNITSQVSAIFCLYKVLYSVCFTLWWQNSLLQKSSLFNKSFEFFLNFAPMAWGIWQDWSGQPASGSRATAKYGYIKIYAFWLLA
jgi:hypothetical protein